MAEKYPYCDMNVSFFVIFRRRWRIYAIVVWAVVTIVLIFEFGKTPLERLNFFVGIGIGLIAYFVGVAVSIYISQLRKEKQIRERIRSSARATHSRALNRLLTPLYTCHFIYLP